MDERRARVHRQGKNDSARPLGTAGDPCQGPITPYTTVTRRAEQGRGMVGHERQSSSRRADQAAARTHVSTQRTVSHSHTSTTDRDALQDFPFFISQFLPSTTRMPPRPPPSRHLPVLASISRPGMRARSEGTAGPCPAASHPPRLVARLRPQLDFDHSIAGSAGSHGTPTGKAVPNVASR